MKTDRTTKLLLLAIASALWVQILRPAFAPTPATAEAGPIQVDIVRVKGQDLVSTVVPVDGSSISVWPLKVKVEN